MKDEEILNAYIPMVKFLSELCGPSSEVLLHNVKNPDNSVIAIENGYYSGRGIGSPLTDLAIEILNSGICKDHDYISNYNGSGKGRNFLSSTFFIKNEGRVIGMLCVNRDITSAEEFAAAFRRLQKNYNLINADTKIKETLEVPTDSMLSGMIQSVFQEAGADPAHMKAKERIEIVRKLKEKGVFEIKGAVPEVARQMNISVPTIYRYMK
jgi:predicted transcriptional regulator YheO